MDPIKNFIYIDEYRMYSISSQIFEGVTEHIVSHRETQADSSEQQKGPVGSGRVLADIIKSGFGTQEKKYLHDYSYKLFEDYLITADKILNIDASNVNDAILKIDTRSFVKVRAKATFNDINMIKSTLEKFNEIGEAISYVANFKNIDEARKQLQALENQIKDGNEKTRLRHKMKELEAKTKTALIQDKTFLDKTRLLLEYGFQDQFEVQMKIDKHLFSADLKRQYLRENEHLLVRKYSRHAEKEFVLFGTVAQSSKQPKETIVEDVAEDAEPTPHMKNALKNILDALSGMESTFTGRLNNEIIIDPIAIYCEL